jgi:mRNA interferase MazF
LTSNLKWAEAPGNVLLEPESTGLEKRCLANVSQIVALDKELLTRCTGKLSKSEMESIFSGIDIVMGR